MNVGAKYLFEQYHELLVNNKKAHGLKVRLHSWQQSKCQQKIVNTHYSDLNQHLK